MIKRLRQWLSGSDARTQANASAAEGGGDGQGEDGQMPPLRVLMVCMGNICRSPTAEGVLRAKLQQAGLQGRVVVDSAGTHGYHAGEPPDPRAVRHAAQRGYDIAGQRARAVSDDDFARFDWILAMDHGNLESLRKRIPAGSSARVQLVLDHGPGRNAAGDVPDPYYGSAAGFEHVLDLLEDACDGFVAVLQTTLRTRLQPAISSRRKT